MPILVLPVSVIAGLAGCMAAVLLWLGGGLALAARLRPVPLRHGLNGAAVLLVACGVWWPGRLLVPADAVLGRPGVQALAAAMLALGLAALARGAGALARRESLALGVGAVLATLAAAGAHSLMVMPALYRWGPLAAAASLLLALALVLPFLGSPGPRASAALRAAGAALGGGVLALGVLAQIGDAPALPLGVDGLLLALLAAMAGVLLSVLQQPSGGTLDEPARRSAPPPATVDPLTRLPTRVEFETRLVKAAKQCDAKSRRMALFFIDLDGFKPVNDSFGHNVGDLVLEQVGERLRTLAKPVGLAARVGGDEFLLLSGHASSDETVGLLAAKLIAELSLPYQADGRELNISCSVGIALYPDSGEAAKLIARADAAMYAAKRMGGSKHTFHTPEMDADAQANFDMVSELRHAMANNELELHYQPKVDARSGKITAAEALVRWRHPTRGMVMPGVFIPLAERYGLIAALGDWVIEEACRQSRAWRTKGLRMRVAINLSTHQLRQDDIVDRLSDALKRHHIHPSLLTCEITESAAMENTRATQETFRRLGELGMHVSIDDFGTGYSSLDTLSTLPAEELKIDRSFVMDLEQNPKSRAIVEAVVKMAHAMGLKVVAEGVENERQKQVLVDLGCDELQGYLFARPMPAHALVMWAIDDRSASAAFRASLFGETKLTKPMN